MRILVTGGAGYIGSHAVRLLLEQGHHVVAYDNLSTGHRAALPVGCLVVGDLLDAARLDQTVREQRIDAVMHFAAASLVGESVKHPAFYYQNNVVGSLNLLESARRHGVERIVFSSTCATYGIPTAVPITEDLPQLPINPYGHTKLAIERALADFSQAYGIGVALLRYFNAVGASPAGGIGEDHEPETHLVPLVVQAALGRRPPVDVFGTDYDTPDGTCIRDYVHVDDLAAAHALALGVIRPGTVRAWNLGTGSGQSVLDVLRAVERVSGRRVPWKASARRLGDPVALVASSQRAQSELGWKPRYPDLESSIETAWNWHTARPRGYDDRITRLSA